jgi:hypothetical protein
MRHMLYCGVLLLTGWGAVPEAARAQAENYSEFRRQLPTGTVRCESNEGRTRQCSADTRGGVRLLRQLSDSACTEGRTWGYGRNGVWVTQGCRAEFAIGGRRFLRDRNTFRCESADGRWRLCPLSRKGRITLVRQLSRSDCIREQSWGHDERGLWVAQGCRGEFRWVDGVEGDGEAGGGNAPPPEIMRCESRGSKERRCPVEVSEGVRLLRQLSNSACIRDQSWGWNREGVWVRNGCRAEFEVR